MAYKYQRVNQSSGAYVYTVAQVNYSITPDYGTPIFPGDTVTITGEAYRIKDQLSNWATQSIEFRLNDYDIKACANVWIAAGAWGQFSMSFTVPESAVEKLTSRWKYTEKNMSVALYPLPDGKTAATGGPSFCSLPDNNDSPEKLLLAKYRITPQIIAMDFERATQEGEWSNDGLYLRCRTLKIAKNIQAVAEDITKATITCIGRDSNAVVADPGCTVELTKDQIAAALTPEGYSEEKPGIFAVFVTVAGLDYTLTLTIGDDYDQTSYSDGVIRSFARLHLSGAKNGGVAVGMFSTSTDDKAKFEVAHDHESFFYGGISGVTNYAEGEVATGGRWMDGKPIYRYVKTYPVTMPCNPWTSIATLPFTIETLISDETLIDESATRGSGGTNPVAYPDSASLNSAVQFWGNTIMSYFGTGWKSYPGRVMYIHVNIEYTKASASDPPMEGPSMALLEAPPDKAIARTDYIAMMAGIEIPEDAETTVEPGAQADPNGMDGPGIDGEPTPSAHYDAVARYYKYDCWSAAMVRMAVGRWITAAEADEILSEEGETHVQT